AQWREPRLAEYEAERNSSLTARGLKKPSGIWDIGHQHLGRSSRLRRRSCGVSIPALLESARESMWRSSTFPRGRESRMWIYDVTVEELVDEMTKSAADKAKQLHRLRGRPC